MKPARIPIACLAVLLLIAAPGTGNAEPPTFRDAGDWIVFSGMRRDGEALEHLTYAIRKSVVTSVQLRSPVDPAEEDSPENEKDPRAEIRITTSELTAGGGNKVYDLGGLTHEGASAMLKQVLEALGPPAEAKGDEKQAEGPRALRLLAVGETPPWEEIEIERDDRRGKARLQAEPPAGSVPPHQVAVVTREGAAEGAPTTLALNRISAVMAVSEGEVALHESNPGGVKKKAWHSVEFPPGARSALAILWRDPEVKKWDKARSLTVRDDVAEIPAGMVHVVNVCGSEVELGLDGERSRLAHRETLLHPAVEGKTHLKVNFLRAKRWTTIANQQITQDAGERAHVIIYLADGEAPRRPVKALVLREVARTPVVPLR